MKVTELQASQPYVYDMLIKYLQIRAKVLAANGKTGKVIYRLVCSNGSRLNGPSEMLARFHKKNGMIKYYTSRQARQARQTYETWSQYLCSGEREEVSEYLAHSTDVAHRRYINADPKKAANTVSRFHGMIENSRRHGDRMPTSQPPVAASEPTVSLELGNQVPGTAAVSTHPAPSAEVCTSATAGAAEADVNTVHSTTTTITTPKHSSSSVFAGSTTPDEGFAASSPPGQTILTPSAQKRATVYEALIKEFEPLGEDMEFPPPLAVAARFKIRKERARQICDFSRHYRCRVIHENAAVKLLKSVARREKVQLIDLRVDNVDSLIPLDNNKFKTLSTRNLQRSEFGRQLRLYYTMLQSGSSPVVTPQDVTSTAFLIESHA
ncbi:unnamed protein product [Mytilus edulis]|uniref:Uncharacterized protein n=1 Tax=Mytilus edulis TaxID=6550 RepID=A0A8S3TQL8_MYTED|nr:unnamed protein product [Mytilus edulis]